MEHTMTEGNVTSQLFSFSVPIVLGNIFQQLYNTADAMIVGKMIGNNAFAAVSVANPIMSVVLFFLVGGSMGVGILLAQWYGAQDMKMFKVQYSTALIAGCAFTVAASLICIACSRWMLLAANTPAEIMEDTNWYLRIIFAGLFFSFLYNYLAAALRAIGDSRSAFLFLVISSVTNVILDVAFIRYTPLGVAGAAVATVISQALSSILCIIYIYRKIPILALSRSEFVYEKSVMKNTLLFSWTSALQQTFLYFGRLLVQGTINAQGTDMITGYNAAIRLEAFMMAFIDGTQNAMSTFGGQNLGAHHPERLKKGLIRTMQMDILYIALFSALMLSIPRTLVGLYVDLDNAAAVEIGVTYITVMPMFYLCCGVVSALQGFFRGIGKIRIAMTATFSQIAMRCVLSVILVPRYGIYGVCASVGTGWVLMVLYSSYNCIHYFRKKTVDNRRTIIENEKINEEDNLMKKVPFVTKEQVEEMAKTWPTPFYVYDEKGILENVRKLKQAFSWNKGYREYFAVKATPNPFIMELLKKEGVGADCSSYTELLMSEAVGLSGHDIMFSSNVTPAQDFQKAAELGAIINFDDITHIDFFAGIAKFPETMCCRYNPGGDFAIHNQIMDSPEDAKYGMTREQLTEAFLKLKAKGVKHFGIHAFLASNTVTNAYYPKLARILFETAVELQQETGVHIAFINLSGGVGIPYTPDKEPNDILAIGEGVHKAYDDILGKAGMDDVAIFTELGRFVLGPYGCLVTKAIHEKHIYKEYIGCDACAANLMRPAIYGAYHHITVLGKENELCDHMYDVTGGLCENNDKFAIDRMLPKIDMGDYLVIHDAGAHGFSMGYNYNGKLRSAELLLHEDGTVQMIRRAETPKDYFATFDFSGLFDAPEYQK